MITRIAPPLFAANRKINRSVTSRQEVAGQREEEEEEEEDGDDDGGGEVGLGGMVAHP